MINNNLRYLHHWRNLVNHISTNNPELFLQLKKKKKENEKVSFAVLHNRFRTL